MGPSSSLEKSGLAAGAENRTLLTTVKAHWDIARLDHSIKNLFILPGIAIPLSVRPDLLSWDLGPKIVLGMIAATLIACSNYVINEVLDAPFDRLHPKKRNRPCARGLVNIPAAYAQWLALMIAGLWVASKVSAPFVITAAALWLMGCFYNIWPFRLKDLVYMDVIAESVNNPLRLLLGWFMITSTLIPPISLLAAYWALGCYFMSLKRFSELRCIEQGVAQSYRESFKRYTERTLLVAAMFYAASSMLFFGAFSMRYRMELILAFPCIAYLMAAYFNLAYEEDSAVQNPEKLYKQPWLMGGVAATCAALTFLLLHPLPMLTRVLVPTLP